MCIHIYNNFIERLPRCYYKNEEFLVWQDDDKCRVGFSELPIVTNKEINVCAMNPEEVKDAEEKPLYLSNTVKVLLIDKKKSKTYVFKIKAGYDYDGASIARLLWRLIGSKECINFKIASLIHDVLCENKHYINNDRYFSTIVFERCLYVGNVEAWRRWSMKHSVDNWQKFQGWEK